MKITGGLIEVWKSGDKKVLLSLIEIKTACTESRKKAFILSGNYKRKNALRFCHGSKLILTRKRTLNPGCLNNQ